jgi:hypothetical protein
MTAQHILGRACPGSFLNGAHSAASRQGQCSHDFAPNQEMSKGFFLEKTASIGLAVEVVFVKTVQ